MAIDINLLAKMMLAHNVTDVESVEEFLQKYCKAERFNGKGRPKDYVQGVIAHNKRNVTDFGYTFLSEHDSVTGHVVSYFPCYRA